MDTMKNLWKRLRARDHKASSLLKQKRASGSTVGKSEQLESRMLLTAVSGFVFNDVNLNGVFDSNESGIANVQVYLDANGNEAFDTGETSTFTANDGSYLLENIAAGNISVRQVVPTGFEQTVPIGTDRLFATTFYGPSRIQELDPNNGAVLNEFPVPSSATSFSLHGLAFDGSSLFFFENNQKYLYEMNPDNGAVLNATNLFQTFANRNMGGLAAMDGKVFFLDITSTTAPPAIVAFDTATNQVTDTFSLAGISVQRGLGVIPEEGLLVLATAQDNLLFIDATSGQIVDTAHFTASPGNETVTGLAVIGDEIHLSGSGRTADVFARDGSFIRSFLGPIESGELAGGTTSGGAHELTVDGTNSVTGLNFGNRAAGAAIQGTNFKDWNGNGVRDEGENPLAGVTIYLDQNQNGQLDPGEVSTVTAADGTYQFTNLAPGAYTVREVPVAGYDSTTLGNDPGTFYGASYIVNSGGLMTYTEVDALTGQVTRIGSPLSDRLHGLIRTNDGEVFGLNGWSSDRIYRVNPETGQLSLVGFTGVQNVFGLAYDPTSDTIYGLGKLNANDSINYLLEIDRVTGAATLIGPGRTGLVGVSAMTFDRETGKIIAFDNNDDEFVAFNSDGTSDQILDTSGLDTWGLTYTPTGYMFSGLGTTSDPNDVDPQDAFYRLNVLTGQRSQVLRLSDSAPFESLHWDNDTSQYRFRLAASEVASGIDFANKPQGAEISGIKFIDVNGNGIRDESELFQAGVTIYLDQNNNGQLDAGEISTVTDADGAYAFTNLAEGIYTVREVLPAGYHSTTQGNDPGTFFGASYVIDSGGQMTFTEVDALTGEVTRIGSPLSARLHGLIRTNSGECYGVNGFNPDRVYKLDPTTGALTLVGQTGIDVVWGLAYDPVTDTIYGVGKPNANDSFGYLLEVDRTDGSVTIIGPGESGFNEVSDLTFDPESRRVIVFDNFDDDFIAFELDGTASVISDLSGIGTWGLTYTAHGYYYSGLGTTSDPNDIDPRSALYVIDPLTGQQSQALALSDGGSFETLDWYNDPSQYRMVVAAGQNVTNIDFANQSLTSEIRGTKYEDLDGDGVRDPNEPGLAGVTIYLDANGNEVLDDGELTTTTDADGNYAFTDLPGGTYFVREIVPENYVQTQPSTHPFYYVLTGARELGKVDTVTGELTIIGTYNIGQTLHGLVRTNDGDLFAISGDGSSDSFYKIDPLTGQATLVGPIGTGVAYGLAYDSANDQIYGIAGGLVSYDRVTGTTTRISAPGTFVPGGISGIAYDDVENRVLVYSYSSGDIYAYDPLTGAASFVVNTQAAMAVNADFVNGQFILKRDFGTANRRFVSIDLTTGAQTTVLEAAAGFRAESIEYVDALGGYYVTLVGGEVSTGNDFGNRLNIGELRGSKFEDLNANGVWDSGEPAMAGATIYLDANANHVLDDGEISTITDENGHYAFTGLPQGNYLVREVVPEGYAQTTPQTDEFYYAINRGPRELVRIDATTGEVTSVGPTNLNRNINGMVRTNSGELFGIAGEGGTSDFYRIDPLTGNATWIGPVGLSVAYGLTYDSATDTIYGIASGSLVTYDRTTGAGTRVSSVNTYVPSSISGIAFDDINNRILAYNINNGQIYGYDAVTGLGSLVVTTASGIGVNADFRDGQFLIKRDFNGPSTQILSIDLQTGAQSLVLGTNRAFIGESLDFVESQDGYFTSVVAGEVTDGLDFGNVRVDAPPQIENISFPTVIYENDIATLSGDVVDTGVLNAFTLTINWGDGSPVEVHSFAAGTTAFSLDHQYLDDNPTGTPGDTYLVTVTLNDDLGAEYSLAGNNVQELITNGNFETGDFTGWTVTANQASGGWSINDGTVDPPGPGGSTAPIDGNYDALVSQTGGGARILSEAFTVPDVVASAVLSWQDRIRNHATEFAEQVQEWRVELVDSSGNVLHEVFATQPGDPNQQLGPNQRSFDLTSVLQSLAGQQVAVRFVEQDSLYFLNVNLDNISLQVSSGFDVQVNNVAPTIVDLNAPVIDENGTATITGTVQDVGSLDTHEVSITWGDGTSEPVTFDPVTGAFAVSHQYLDDNPTGTSVDIYDIGVTVTDDDTGTTTATTTVTVQNLAPMLGGITLTKSGPNDSEVSITGSFTDVGTLDTHEVTIAWGDGTTTTATVDPVTRTFVADYTYGSAGIFEVDVVVLDDDGGEASAQLSTSVVGFGIVGDTLFIVGSCEDDSIHINQQGSDTLHVSGNPTGQWVQQTFALADFTQIVAVLCDGNDQFFMTPNLDIPAHVSGGNGDDAIRTGASNDYVDGGEGNNKIWTNGGDDEVVAGSGNNEIWTDGGNDIVVAGDGNNKVWGGKGNDTVTTGSGNDELFGGDGNDSLNAGDGNNKLFGGNGDDILLAGSGVDEAFGDGGNDAISTGGGDDKAFGGSGLDILIGGDGSDELHGGSHEDLLIANIAANGDSTTALDAALALWASGDQADALLELGILSEDDDDDRIFGGGGADELEGTLDDVLHS